MPDIPKPSSGAAETAASLPPSVERLLACLEASDPLSPPKVSDIARDIGATERTASWAIRRAKAVGLLRVARLGRRNIYTIDHEALRRLAGR